MIQEISLYNNVKCVYNDKNEVYQAVFYLKNWTEVRLALQCDPENPASVFAMKFIADTFFEDLDHWTQYAQEFVIRRFLPYFYRVAGEGSEIVLDKKRLKSMLILSRITINSEGKLTMAFKPFSIGKRTSVLWVYGNMKEGFTELCDQMEIIPKGDREEYPETDSEFGE